MNCHAAAYSSLKMITSSVDSCTKSYSYLLRGGCILFSTEYHKTLGKVLRTFPFQKFVYFHFNRKVAIKSNEYMLPGCTKYPTLLGVSRLTSSTANFSKMFTSSMGEVFRCFLGSLGNILTLAVTNEIPPFLWISAWDTGPTTILLLAYIMLLSHDPSDKGNNWTI